MDKTFRNIFFLLNKKEITDLFTNENGISYLSTLDKIYRLKEERNVDLEETKCLTATQFYKKQLIKDNPELQPILSTNENIETIKHYSHNSIYYQTNSTKNNICLDKFLINLQI